MILGFLDVFSSLLPLHSSLDKNVGEGCVPSAGCFLGSAVGMQRSWCCPGGSPAVVMENASPLVWMMLQGHHLCQL